MDGESRREVLRTRLSFARLQRKRGVSSVVIARILVSGTVGVPPAGLGVSPKSLSTPLCGDGCCLGLCGYY